MRALKKNNESGFTLIEVVIAFAVLMIATAGALEAIYAANILSIEAKEKTIAMNDARATLEQIKITSLGSLPQDSNIVNASTIWGDINTFISNDLNNEQVLVQGMTGSSLRQIVVTVQWTGPRNRTKFIRVTTMKSFFNG